MFASELSQGSKAIFATMAGDLADRYLEEMLYPSLARTGLGPINEPRSQLESVEGCLRAVLGHYAFCRRGKDRAELSCIALSAMDRVAEFVGFPEMMLRENGEDLWNAFAEICTHRGRKPMEQLNCGVVAGMVELAQEIFEIDQTGSIAKWIVRGIETHGRLEPHFLRIVDVRGVGPKLASMLLRDIIDIFDLEARVDPAERLYCIPIDKWTRLIGPYIIDEPQADSMADWVLAGKVCKYARRAGVSPLRFSMGLAYFGQRWININQPFGQQLQSVVNSRVTLQ